MSFFDDFSEMRRDRDSFAKMARRAPAGLPNEQLTPGLAITISPNLSTGDRSYTDNILEVVGVVGAQVLCKKVWPKLYSFDRSSIMLVLHEHEFYDATHVLEAALQMLVDDERRKAEAKAKSQESSNA